jgi:hypothetical protein
MKYMLLMYWHESAGPTTPEELQDLRGAWSALRKEMKAAGALLGANGLDPIANATTVRVREHKTLITDGPFAETHEKLGGYFLLECADLDEAIGWAEKIPAAKYGSIEIHPLWGQK